MNPFSFKQTEGANLQALTYSISLLAISPFLFKGNFLWMFPIQLKQQGQYQVQVIFYLAYIPKGEACISIL